MTHSQTGKKNPLLRNKIINRTRPRDGPDFRTRQGLYNNYNQHVKGSHEKGKQLT